MTERKLFEVEEQVIETGFKVGDEVIELDFATTDENVEKITKEIPKAEKEYNKRSKSEDEDEVELLKEMVEEFYNTLFGEGTFDEVYEVIQSYDLCLIYLLHVTKHITEELNIRQQKRRQDEVMNEYLTESQKDRQGKKKKKGKR